MEKKKHDTVAVTSGPLVFILFLGLEKKRIIK